MPNFSFLAFIEVARLVRLSRLVSKLYNELAVFQTYRSHETLIADIGMSSKKKLYHIHAYKNHSKILSKLKSIFSSLHRRLQIINI